MALLCCSTAILQCPFGVAPAPLTVPPVKRVNDGGPPSANIMDNIPFTNIPSFGMCSSLANPAVASATTAALGVLTPMPCTPVIPAPWAPGTPTVLVGPMPGLNDSSILMCAWGGAIAVKMAGQFTVEVP